jgi:hypothetical protein
MRPGARTAQIFSALVGFGVGLYVTSSLKCCRFSLPRCCFTDTSRYHRFHLYQLRWFGFSADGIQRFGLVEVSVTCLLVRFTINYSSHCQTGSLPIAG